MAQRKLTFGLLDSRMFTEFDGEWRMQFNSRKVCCVVPRRHFSHAYHRTFSNHPAFGNNNNAKMLEVKMNAKRKALYMRRHALMANSFFFFFCPLFCPDVRNLG